MPILLCEFQMLAQEALPPDAVRLMVALAVALAAAAWIVPLANWMIAGDLDYKVGFAGILAAVLMMALAIWPPHPAVRGMVFVVLISTVVFFPFAYSQLTRREHRLADTEDLEKALAAFAAHPDNIGARMQMARSLHMHGMTAQAVAIAESALAGLSEEVDPVSNRSYRDLFRKELSDARQWRASLRGDAMQRPLKCPSCGRPNMPGVIVCAGCNRPYLLDLARQGNVRSRFIGRLVAGWTIVALALPAAAWAGFQFHEEPIQPYAIAGVILAAGVALALLFWSERTPGDDRREW